MLLTAAVTPNIPNPGVLSDADTRRSQYQAAFDYWQRVCELSGMGLVIVETTGARRDEFFGQNALAEWIQFTPRDEILARGKGAAEASALAVAADHLLSQVSGSFTVHKVTGRLLVKNWTAALLACGQREVRVRRTLDRGYCDTRLLSAPLDIFRGLMAGAEIDIDDSAGVYLEHVIAMRIIELEYRHGVRVERFAAPPRFEGVSGQSGKPYSSVIAEARRQAFRGIDGFFSGLSKRKAV